MAGAFFQSSYGFAMIVALSYATVMGVQYYSAEKSITSARMLLASAGAHDDKFEDSDE
jgi:hypothetical protein